MCSPFETGIGIRVQFLPVDVMQIGDVSDERH
jgi:hypothetical protein